MMVSMTITHTPVLLDQVVELLTPSTSTATVIDATLGEGGHAEAFLSRYPEIFLVGIDADPMILEVARSRLGRFTPRTKLLNQWFSEFFAAGSEHLPAAPEVVYFDLGISRYHYEQAQRGFSFSRDEKLDMRLVESLPETAADIVNRWSAQELECALFDYGEERFAKRIVRAIVRQREHTPFENSLHLARVVVDAVPQSYTRSTHPATKTFQALRIVVNRELDQLEIGLRAALTMLAVGGKLGVISFHSLEDRIVKNVFRQMSRACTCPPEQPICKCRGTKRFQMMTKKPILATPEEVRGNPAARSAKLRTIHKLSAEVT